MNRTMLFKIIVIGRLRDKMIESHVGEYRKRIGAYGKVEYLELADSTVSGEGAMLLRELDKERHAEIIVLSEEGRTFTSVQFAARLAGIDRKLVFVIGGPFGLAPEVKQRADLLWSLSPLTFPHEIARLLLFEQLYRAMNINHSGSYHH